jgi:hypothetical protein
MQRLLQKGREEGIKTKKDDQNSNVIDKATKIRCEGEPKRQINKDLS